MTPVFSHHTKPIIVNILIPSSIILVLTIQRSRIGMGVASNMGTQQQLQIIAIESNMLNWLILNDENLIQVWLVFLVNKTRYVCICLTACAHTFLAFLRFLISLKIIALLLKSNSLNILLELRPTSLHHRGRR